MGSLRTSLSLVLVAACGSSSNKPADAPPAPDASPDAKMFLDAAIDAPRMADLSCVGTQPPGTATDPVTVAGMTEAPDTNGMVQPLPMVTVTAYKSIAPKVAIDTQTSAADGTFTTGNLDIGNTGMPVDGFIEGSLATYRTTYLYPPFPLTKATANVPVLLLGDQLFGFLTSTLGITQDDGANGVLYVQVVDCTGVGINGATLKVQQNSMDVGTQQDLGALSNSPQAAGSFLVFNVPDGATQVFATYLGTTFAGHTVLAHKKPPGMNSEGTMTLTQLRPGA